MSADSSAAASNRNTVQQVPPAPGLDLRDFPWVPAPTEKIYRAHDSNWGVGWFAHAGNGRFDLTTPLGTMYFGDTLRTAVRESLGNRAYNKTISHEAALHVRVVTTRMPSTGRFALVSDERAEDFGIIRELVTMPEYEVPQQWAAAFRVAGFAGIRYQSRFTAGQTVNAWALFGEAGETNIVNELAVTKGLDACRKANISFLPRIPSSTRVTTIA